MTAESPGNARRPEFIGRQLEFTAHVRDPKRHPCPADVEERRMAVYRELLYNNVEGFVSGAFPVLRSLMDDGQWHALVRDFFARHRCTSPLFLEIPREFLDYLREQRAPEPGDPPFLDELAHYEWVELALSVLDAKLDEHAVDPEGDLLAGSPVLSPAAWCLRYAYPVHRIGPGYRPDGPGKAPTHLLVYRGGDEEVHFMEVNAVTARLLELLGGEPAPGGRRALERIARELRHAEPQAVIDAGRAVLEDLRARGVVLGARTPWRRGPK